MKEQWKSPVSLNTEQCIFQSEHKKYMKWTISQEPPGCVTILTEGEAKEGRTEKGLKETMIENFLCVTKDPIYRFRKIGILCVGWTQRNPHPGRSQSNFGTLKTKTFKTATEKWPCMWQKRLEYDGREKVVQPFPAKEKHC